MKKLINKICRYLLQKTCEHKNKVTKYIDYQDRYCKDYCPDCNKTIYTGID